MFRLSSILNEVLEGAKVTFDDKGKPTSIDIAVKHLDGEQLDTYNGRIKKNSYEVYYSLISDPKAGKVKPAQDALKYNSQLIKPAELKSLVSDTLTAVLPKIDYIGYLESEGSLNKLLLDTIKGLYPSAEVVHVEKIAYSDLSKAVNWESVSRQTDKIKQAILSWLEKSKEKDMPQKIRKSNEMQSVVAKQLYSKYNFGLHPSGEGEKFPPVYNMVVECLTRGKTMLIIDDNMYTGDDFYKIFESIERIKDRLKEENEIPVQKESEAFKELDKIKQHPKFKTSEFLQKKAQELEKVRELYRTRVSILNSNLNKSRLNFYGYVLYKLELRDLKST